MMLDRQKLTDAWYKRFDGLDKGYWISLNSKIRVEGLADPRLPDRLMKFEPMVEKFIHQINEKCFGRRYIKDPSIRLTCLAGYEVGKVDGLVHCHIIAAHDGGTDRTVEEIREISKRKWDGICNTNGSQQFVHVDEVENVQSRLWYLTKQACEMERVHKVSNLSLY